MFKHGTTIAWVAIVGYDRHHRHIESPALASSLPRFLLAFFSDGQWSIDAGYAILTKIITLEVEAGSGSNPQIRLHLLIFYIHRISVGLIKPPCLAKRTSTIAWVAIVGSWQHAADLASFFSMIGDEYYISQEDTITFTEPQKSEDS